MEIMWPETVASSVPAFKLHWGVVYGEPSLMTAIPLRDWRKPAAFFIVGNRLGPSTICSARIRLTGSCCGAARSLLFYCHPVRASVLSGQDIGVSQQDPMAEEIVLRQADSRLCTVRLIELFFRSLIQFVPPTLCRILRGILYSNASQN